ncbi:MAG: hypothetical protein ACN4GW_21275 [Desulforhopalus sp.]
MCKQFSLYYFDETITTDIRVIAATPQATFDHSITTCHPLRHVTIASIVTACCGATSKYKPQAEY